MKTEEDYIFFHHPLKENYRYSISPLQKLKSETLENLVYKNKNFNYTNSNSFPNSLQTQTITYSYRKRNSNNINNNLRKNKIKNSVKLPLLINKNLISSFEKRKKYKIILPEKNKNLHSVTIKKDETKEEKKDGANKKKNEKNKYINYFLRKSERRRKKLNNLLDEINDTEDRFNKEIPDEDSNFVSKDKFLLDNKWKNSFYLDEYQQFFMNNLKGKISNMNYRLMLKKFRDISQMCFSPGNEHNIPKKINYIE